MSSFIHIILALIVLNKLTNSFVLNKSEDDLHQLESTDTDATSPTMVVTTTTTTTKQSDHRLNFMNFLSAAQQVLATASTSIDSLEVDPSATVDSDVEGKM